MASHRRRSFSSGARRETSWLGLPALNVNVAPGVAALTHALTDDEKLHRPFTIVRTHVHVMVQSDQSAASENVVIGVGASVVSDQSLAIGVTAVPTPITDLGSDMWFFHQLATARFAFNTAVGFDDHAAEHYTWESRAMRKVNDAQDIVFSVEASVAGSGALITIIGRLLIKEH